MGGRAHVRSAPPRTDIVLEAAWFKPEVIAGRARRFGLQTDASQRFERGVDWRGQERALALAKRLMLRYRRRQRRSGRSPRSCRTSCRSTRACALRDQQLQRLLGVSVAPSQVEQRLRASGMHGDAPNSGGWSVQPPSWRFDIAIEADLIEEVGAHRRSAMPSRSARRVMPIAPRALASQRGR